MIQWALKPQKIEQDQKIDAEEAARRQGRIWTIPNGLTSLRLASGPAVAYWVASGGSATVALGIFVAAAATDGLDGWIARRYDQQSRLGTILDPLSDKVTVVSLLSVLGYQGTVAPAVVGLAVARDVAIAAAAMRIRYRLLQRPSLWGFIHGNAPMEARVSRMSKLNTVAQLSLIGAALASQAFPDLALLAASVPALAWTSAATTVASGLGYIYYRAEAIHTPSS